MDPIIKIENLSKLYRLGTVGTGTLTSDLHRWYCRIRGKEDPYLKIGEVNDRSTKGESEYVWALKDINLEVMPGEVLGIIGKNGAGKSTLLKILSKVTGPTTGTVKYNGRIGSLLEVGTGFHGELTGRENIFLNGAILGMSKSEIRNKLDEIIDFSGCERYIDTPVKRYSSGMIVRLGFAVAAFLEPEILIVDEVLAVGDAEFQKKALGKMQDVSKNDGRTILFVSHNMTAVRGLCKNGIVLENGFLTFNDIIQNTVDYYLNEKNTIDRENTIENTDLFRRNKDLSFIKIISVGLIKQNNDNIFKVFEPINIFCTVKGLSNISDLRIAGSIYNYEDLRIGLFFTKETFSVNQNQIIKLDFQLSNHNLTIGKYYISLSVGIGDYSTGNTEFDILEEIIHFEIQSNSDLISSKIIKWNKDWGNIIFPSNLLSINTIQ